MGHSHHSHHNSLRKEESKTAIKVSVVSIVANLLLAAFKVLAGVLANSTAMISDAIHTASDVFSTLVVLFGIQLSRRAPNEKYPYGHERFESIAALLLSIMLFVSGAGIGVNAITKIIQGVGGELEAPGVFALIAAIVGIVVKEWMFHYMKSAAKKIGSKALLADAWHHRTDAFASIGSLLGIVGARLGLPILDPIMGIVISVLVLKAAIEIFLDSTKNLIDRSLSLPEEDTLRALALAQEGVQSIVALRTRRFGPRAYADVAVAVDSTLTVTDAYRIQCAVEEAIEHNMAHVLHASVLTQPAEHSIVTEP